MTLWGHYVPAHGARPLSFPPTGAPPFPAFRFGKATVSAAKRDNTGPQRRHLRASLRPFQGLGGSL